MSDLTVLVKEVKKLLKKCNNNIDLLSYAKEKLNSVQKQYSDFEINTNPINAITLNLNSSTLKYKSEVESLNSKVLSLNSRIQKLESAVSSGGLSDSELAELNNNIKIETSKTSAKLSTDIETNNTKTKNELYSAIAGNGAEGEFLQIKYNSELGRNEVQPTDLVNFSKIAVTSEQVDALKLEPVGMKLIFDKWYRFTHGNNDQRTSDQNLNDGNGPHNSTRNAWSYVPATSSIRSNINSQVYSCFVSDRKYDNWYLKMRATGDDGDNDLFSILLGFMTDANGREHTLSVVRTLCVEGHTKYLWSIVYDYMQDLEFELVSNSCSQIVSLPGGWLNRYAIIEARRTKTNLKCYTSVISTSTNIESLPDSKLEYTLPLTKPSNYSQAMYDNIKTMLSNPSQMGVGCHSQPGNFTILEQKYIFDDEKIYDFASNTIWEYNEVENKWHSVGNCNSLLDSFQYSKTVGDLYYLYNGGAYNLNNQSTKVNEDNVNNVLQQLSTELQTKDSEVLTESKKYTDSKTVHCKTELESLKTRVSKLETFFNELKTRVQ